MTRPAYRLTPKGDALVDAMLDLAALRSETDGVDLPDDERLRVNERKRALQARIRRLSAPPPRAAAEGETMP